MANGKLIGKDITPTAETRPNGVWNLVDQYVYNRRDVWVEEAALEPVTPYGFQGTATHVSHDSSAITGSINLGTLYGDREVWLIVVNMSSTTTNSISSISLGGLTPTLADSTENTTNPSTNNTKISYYRVVDNGSLGTSATYNISFTTTQVHTGLLIFSSPVTSTTIDYKGNALDGTPSNVTLNTGGGIWAISVTSSQNSSTGTLPNFGNDGSFDYGTGEWLTYGYNTNPLSSTTEITPSTGAALEENTITGLCRL